MINAAEARVPIDVIVLTGFLGAGKTTLLNRILTAPTQRRIAVIVNEFGEVGIDHDLLIASGLRIIEMSNGCICCSVNGDLVRGLSELLARRAEFDTLVIETTGLADPAPVVQSLHADAALRDTYRLRGVVTLIDAKHIAQQIETVPEARSQITFADLILLNKIDLATADALDALEARLHAINPHAPIAQTRDADTDIAAILDLAPLSMTPDAISHDCAYHGHRHSPDMQTVSIAAPGALDGLKLGAWLQNLTESGADILRIKGILNIWGDHDQFWFQGVQREYDCRPGRRWHDDEARLNRLVFIGKNLDEAALRDGFGRCVTTAAEPSRTTPDRFGRWHEETSPQRLDQIKFWMRQNFGFPVRIPILIKEVPCAKPGCPPIETAIIALVDDAPPRLFKVQASINDLTFDQVYDLMENPMPCC